MVIVDEPERLVALAQRNDVVDLVRGIARIRVAHPLQVAQRAAVAVVAAAVRVLDERLARAVRLEVRDAAGPRVRESRPERSPEVVLGRHVHHRIVDEDDVERPAEAKCPHVSERCARTRG